MSTPELREKLLERIRVTTDAKLLRAVDRLLRDAEKEGTYATNAHQRAAIAKSRRAVKRGRVRPAAEADKAIEEWLGK